MPFATTPSAKYCSAKKTQKNYLLKTGTLLRFALKTFSSGFNRIFFLHEILNVLSYVL